MEVCKFCNGSHLVKSGFVRNKQRYVCKICGKNQVSGDSRVSYDNQIRKAAIVLYLEGNGFRRIARCLNEI
ncbi:MAG: IS1 family transposase, partial [Pseudomonadota bacterium]